MWTILHLSFNIHGAVPPLIEVNSKRKFCLNRAVVLSLYIFVVQVFCGGQTGDFCYDEPSCGVNSWGEFNGVCQSGNFQSPINLDRSKVKKIQKSVNLVLSKEYAYVHTSFWMRNNGHTVVLALNKDDTSNCLVRGNGFLPNEPFFFSSLHFHWGSDEFSGSEHTINGRAFPLELHMIHRQSTNLNQLAVFGILYQISEYDNPALFPIIDNLNLVKEYSDNPVMISPAYYINLTSFLPKKIKVFRYQGSLTTPPCSEGVIWTVFDEIQPVSRRQLMALRNPTQRNGRPLSPNFRPVQATYTNQRKNVFYMKSMVPTASMVKKKNG